VGALRRRAVALAAVAAAVAAALVLVLARGGAAPAVEPAAPVSVRAALDERVVQLGDPVTARVVVALDRSAVRAGTLHVATDLAPLTPLSSPTMVRAVAGRLETVTLTQRAACLTQPCLARTVALRPVRVAVSARDGRVTTVSAAWRPLRLRPRVTAGDLAAANPRFAADTDPGVVSYRVAPGTAAAALEVVAAVAAAAAATLLALEALAVGRRRRRAAADGDELARALRLVREAEARPAPDRRRALALLARLLRGRDRALGRAASDLAWSRPAPEPEAAGALAARVERERG
jgi:hypothetical protein